MVVITCGLTVSPRRDLSPGARTAAASWPSLPWWKVRALAFQRALGRSATTTLSPQPSPAEPSAFTILLLLCPAEAAGKVACGSREALGLTISGFLPQSFRPSASRVIQYFHPLSLLLFSSSSSSLFRFCLDCGSFFVSVLFCFHLCISHPFPHRYLSPRLSQKRPAWMPDITHKESVLSGYSIDHGRKQAPAGASWRLNWDFAVAKERELCQSRRRCYSAGGTPITAPGSRLGI